jgi:hypothetical protein
MGDPDSLLSTVTQGTIFYFSRRAGYNKLFFAHPAYRAVSKGKQISSN